MTVVGLTEAQAELLADESSRFLGFVGGYGAGKSRALGLKTLRLAEANAPYPIIACEPSFRQVKRVLLPTLRDIMLQIDPHAWKTKVFNKLDMELRLTLNGKECTIFLSNAKDPDGIAGINAAAALVDEAALVSDEVLEQIRARVREERAPVRQMCLFGTPDNGKKGNFYEWLAGDDRLPNSRLIRASSRENYFLDEGYVDEQLAGYDEQEKLRYIEGHFIDFAGRVYTQYKTEVHEIECQTPDEGDLVIGADFGRGCMPFAIGRIVGEQVHFFDELVCEGHDVLDAADKLAVKVAGLLTRRAQAAGSPYTVSPDDLEALGNVTVYADPAGTALYRGSASEVRVLRARGFNVITRRTHPRIMDRVNAVQQKLKRGDLFVDPNGAPYVAKCLREQGFGPNGLPEKSMPKQGKKGLDHGCLVAGTMVHTVGGMMPIEQIKKGHLVHTRKGVRAVLWSGMTKKNAPLLTVTASNGASVTGTGNHPFLTQRGWVRLDDLSPSDYLVASTDAIGILGGCENKSHSTEQLTQEATGRGTTGHQVAADTSTGMFTSTPTARSRTGTKSTTSTGTETTTARKTLSLLPPSSTQTCTDMTGRTTGSAAASSAHEKRPGPGTVARQVACGTVSTQKGNSQGRREPKSGVSIAARATPSASLQRTGRGSARKNAKRTLERRQESTTSTLRAPTAAQDSGKTSTLPSGFVLVPVQTVRESGRADVYDLTIEDAHEFVSNGLVTHNSDAVGYLCEYVWPAALGQTSQGYYH